MNNVNIQEYKIEVLALHLRPCKFAIPFGGMKDYQGPPPNVDRVLIVWVRNYETACRVIFHGTLENAILASLDLSAKRRTQYRP